MPSLIIHREDFALLTEATKKEILTLLLKDSAGEAVENNFKLDHNIDPISRSRGPSLDTWRNLASDFAHSKHNHAKMELMLNDLHALLPKVFGPFPAFQNVHAVSVELALSVLNGLGEDSKNALHAIVMSSHLQGVSREELAHIVDGVGKINGTIGSINRRYSRRFNADIYGSQVDGFKIIEFKDGFYKLTCDPTGFELAFKLISSNKLNHQGNYSVELHGVDGKKITHDIDALAIKYADAGMAFVDTIYDEYEAENGSHCDRYNVAISLPQSTLRLGVNGLWVVRELQFDRFLGNVSECFD